MTTDPKSAVAYSVYIHQVSPHYKI